MSATNPEYSQPRFGIGRRITRFGKYGTFEGSAQEDGLMVDLNLFTHGFKFAHSEIASAGITF
jgi:hypothetical protein